MLMTPETFLSHIKNLVVGSNKAAKTNGAQGSDGGFNQDYSIALSDVVPATASTTLVTDAAGLHALKSLHSQTTIGTAGFVVPRDYDQNTDKFILRITAAMGGTTDTPVVSVTSSTQAVGANQSTYGAIAAGTIGSTSALNNVISIYEVDLSNQGLVRDTIVALKLTAGAHTTDDLFIYNLEIVYASCLVGFQEAFNTAGKSVGYDAVGNPIR